MCQAVPWRLFSLVSGDEKDKYYIYQQIVLQRLYFVLTGSYKMGSMAGFDEICIKLDSMYEKIVGWKLNLFEVH